MVISLPDVVISLPKKRTCIYYYYIYIRFWPGPTHNPTHKGVQCSFSNRNRSLTQCCLGEPTHNPAHNPTHVGLQCSFSNRNRSLTQRCLGSTPSMPFPFCYPSLLLQTNSQSCPFITRKAPSQSRLSVLSGMQDFSTEQALVSSLTQKLLQTHDRGVPRSELSPNLSKRANIPWLQPAAAAPPGLATTPVQSPLHAAVPCTRAERPGRVQMPAAFLWLPERT